MIRNDLQYRVKKSALNRFRETLDKHDQLTSDQEAWVRELHRESITGEIRQLEAEIEEYERIKSGNYEAPALSVVEQIPSMLIQRRIALGWTQEDLAKRLGVKSQQVQADEATNYASANLARLMRTAAILQRARKKRAATERKSANSVVAREIVQEKECLAYDSVTQRSVSIRDIIRQQEEDAYVRVCTYLGDTACLVDGVSELYEAFFELVLQADIKLQRNTLEAFLDCLQLCRYQLVMGVLTMFRGHVTDAAAYTRKAIEASSFAIDIYRDPKSASRWVDLASSKKAKDRYRSTFQVTQVINRTKDILGDRLIGLYDTYCLSVHPSLQSVFKQATLREQEHRFEYFELQNERQFKYLAGELFMLLDAHLLILWAWSTLLEQPKTAFDTLKWQALLKPYVLRAEKFRIPWKAEFDRLVKDADASST